MKRILNNKTIFNIIILFILIEKNAYMMQDIIKEKNYFNDSDKTQGILLDKEESTIYNNGKIQNLNKVNQNSELISNGIESHKNIESLDNNGVILGSAEVIEPVNNVTNSGNGIALENLETKFLKNNGYINGSFIANDLIDSSGNSGNGVNLIGNDTGQTQMGAKIIGSKLDKIVNEGVISGKVDSRNANRGLYNSGNAINIAPKDLIGGSYYFKSEVGSFKNFGRVIGEAYIENQNSRNIGNGLTAFGSYESKADEIVNQGVIKGNVFSNLNIENSGNGIHLSSFGHFFGGDFITSKIENKGIVEGEANTSALNFGSGNGIIIDGRGTQTKIENLENSGVISGYSSKLNNEKSGNGVYSGYNITTLFNEGVIKGNNTAISFGGVKDANFNGKLTSLANNGILIGNNIFRVGKIPENEVNNGLYINLKENGEVESIRRDLNNATDNNGREIINIVNGLDGYILAGSEYKNKVLNGAGVSTGTLTLSKNQITTVENTIINAYKTAVTLNDNTNLKIQDSLINGGGIKNENPVIQVLGNETNLDITKNTILNGKVSVDGNNNTLYIDNSVKINGDIVSKGQLNTLKLGTSNSNEELKIYDKIENFDEIKTNGKVTLYSTSKVNAVADIDIEHGTLLVRLDGSKRDEKGRVIGHALYDHTGAIILGEKGNVGDHLPDGDNHPDIQAGAQLFFKASGLTNGTVIAMKETDITGLKDSQIGTYSIAHTARKFIPGKDDIWLLNSGTNTYAIRATETIDIIIDTLNLDDIINRPDDKEKPDNKGEEKPDNPPDNEVEDREDLGDIWDSIVNGGEEDYLAPTLDYEDGKNIVEAKKELISILDQIYANNPYSYIGEASKESLRLYQDNIFTTKMPKKDEWITEAHGIYGYDKFEKAEQNNRFGKEIQKNSYSSNVSTYGMLGTAEYGILEDTSLGIAIGGSKQKVDMSKGTKIDGNSGYIGVYGKKNINRFRITSGIGYQHNEYDVDRILINKYQEFKNNGSLSTDSIGVYLEGKYFIKSETGVSIEPKLRLSYMNISQEEVKEKSNELAIDVDGKNYQNTDILIGVDFSKKKYLKGGLLEFKGELSYMKTLDTERDYLTGRIKNSTSFKIKGPEITEDRIRIIVGIDYEKVNGVFYNLYTGVELADKDRIDTNVKIGVGYRF
ncbi:MAG: autotransporter domain-containing protein [Cetobacterium sp.]